MPVDKSSERVQAMFGQIAPRYDFLNRLLSAGIDRRWRAQTVAYVPPGQGPVLDVCTGTGDLALAYWRAGHGNVSVAGFDFCLPMLRYAIEKRGRAGIEQGLDLMAADATRIPFPNDTFAVVCVAFGLRNVSDPQQGLCEMVRVCRPEGRVAILEFTLPQRQPWRSLYGWYFRRVLPRIGQLLARNQHAAYEYLPESVGEFPQGPAFLERMAAAGLRQLHQHVLTLGAASLYVGVK